MEDSLEEGECQSNSVKLPLLLEDEGTASHCDLKNMEEHGDESETDKNALQNEREELCKVMPECIQNNCATKLSDGESAGDCSNGTGIMSTNEDREKGKSVEGIEYNGENVQSEAGCADESETSSEKLNVGKENYSNESGNIFERVREVSESHLAVHEGESDVSKSNEENGAGKAVYAGNESNVNFDSGGFENEENNQNMSSLIFEGDKKEVKTRIMNIPCSEGDENREYIQNMNNFDSSGDGNNISLYLSSSSDMEASEDEETSQALNNSAIESDETEETRQTMSNSVIEGDETEETRQAMSNSATEDGEIEETSQTGSNSVIEDVETEETGKAVSNSVIEGGENEETGEAVNNSVIEDVETEETRQAVSNSVIEGGETEETSQTTSNSTIEGDDNEETSQTLCNAAIEGGETEETSQASNSTIEGGETEETSQASNSTIEGGENEETSQATSHSAIEGGDNEETSQTLCNAAIEGAENEETSQATSNSTIEGGDNEETSQTLCNAAIEGAENEETSQATSNSAIEGGDNEETSQTSNSAIEGAENEETRQATNNSVIEDGENKETNQAMSNSAIEGGDEETSQAVSNSAIEGGDETSQATNNSVIERGDEETSQALNSSNLDGNKNEDVCQSTIESVLQDNGNRENNQSRASSGLESEENGQMMCNAGMESNENENCQVLTGTVMEDNENGNTLIRMKDGGKMKVVNEKESESGHSMNFPGKEKNSVLNEEHIQESNKGGSTEEETQKNPNSYVIQEQLQDFTKETQDCLGAEDSRLRDTQEHSMKRSFGEEENIADSSDCVQIAEISEEQEQDLRIMTEKEGKDAEIESRRKKDEEPQSEAEQEEMEAEGCRVEGEEQGESTLLGKDEENKTPRDVESGRMCEKEQLEKEEGNIDVQEINANKENDKTQEPVDKELRQLNKRNAITVGSDINRSKDGITTGHDEPDQDVHNLDEQSLKLTHEAKSKPQQEKTDTNMQEVTLSEDMQNETGAKEITQKDMDQPEELNITNDMLNQTNKPGLADKGVNEEANTSQESTPEEASQNQNEEIGSASQKIKKDEISYRSRKEEDRSKEVMVQQNATTSQTTEAMDKVMVLNHNTSTSQVSKESEHPEGGTSSKCDNSRTMKHTDSVTAAPACKKKLICNKNTVTDKMPPNQQNIAKKSTSKMTPRAAVHKQQPSTQETQSEEQDAEDSDDSDIVVLSETIKTPANPTRFAGLALLCHTCNHLWNNEVLGAIFDGNKCVTVNSKITYGAIICFSNYADIHYPQNKEKAVRNVLERADLSKNIGNMKIKEAIEWLRYLMTSGTVTCCTVFDAVYNPRATDVILSSLIIPKPASQKDNETLKSKEQNESKVKKKTPQRQSSCTSKTKHKAETSSKTTTSSTNTTGVKKMTPSKLSEAKKIQSTTARGSSSTQRKKFKTAFGKQDMHASETPVISSRDDSQSLNKNFVLKKCSVYLGKPVPVSSQQRVSSPVSSSSGRSSATKRSFTEEEDKSQQRVSSSSGRSSATKRSLTAEEDKSQQRVYSPVSSSSGRSSATKRSLTEEEDKSQQSICSPVSSSSGRSSATKRSFTEKGDKSRQPRKKGRSLRHSLSREDSTDTNSSSETSVKDAVELPMEENSTTDLSSENVSKGFFSDSNEDDTLSKGSESNLDVLENEESSSDSSDFVPAKSSNQLADKTMTDSEPSSTAKVKEDIVGKDQIKAEGYRKGKTKLPGKSKTPANQKNKDMKDSNKKGKTSKTNSKDAGQILTRKAEPSLDGVVSNITKSQEDSRNTEKHDLQSTKATSENENEKAEQTITKDAEVEKHDKCERNKEANKTDTKDSKCSNRKEEIGKDADQTPAHRSEASVDDTVSNIVKSQDGNKNMERHDLQSTETTNRNEKAEQTITKDTEVEKHDKCERNEEANKTDIETERCEKNYKTEDVSNDEVETKNHDKNEESEKRSVEDAKAGHENHKRSEIVMEDTEIERHESSEDLIMKDADMKRHDKTKIGEINMIDAEHDVIEKQVMSTVESVGNTGEHEDPSEEVKRHDGKNIEFFSANTEPEDANMKDAKEQTVTEKQNMPSDVSSGNNFTNQIKRSAEGSSTHSSKRQKVSDGTIEESPKDAEIQEAKDLTKVMEGVPSKPQRRTRTRTVTQRFCSTDSKESESSMPASFEGMESSPSCERTPNCESSDEFEENTSKARLVSKEKIEEKLKSPRVLRSKLQRPVSKKIVSSSETSSDSNDQPMSRDDSVPQSRTCMNYKPVSSTKNNKESENILVQKLGLNINAIDLYCNTTDSKMPTNRDMANVPRQRGRLTKALEAMFRERSNLDGVAKEAFDLLPFEQHNVIGTANNKERYLTNQELLVLQNICVLNPEAPDVDMFYQILIQVLLARRQVLLVPNSLALLVVAEKIRREFNRAKRKGNHSEYLAHDWDPCKIYTTEDFWLAEKKPPRVPTVRTVLSIFCLWKNLEKRVPISLPIALEELCRNLVLWDVDKIGMCVKLYSRYCTFLYEEKNPSLTEIFLNQPFIGSKTKLQKKLLLSKENNSKDTSGNFSSKPNTNVTENDVQALLKQCLEAEQAALCSSHPREEEWFRKCVQALKDKVDEYKKEIQLIQKVTKDTEKKKFQLLSRFNSTENVKFPQELGKTTETLYRLLAKTTTKFEMLKETEYRAAKETNEVPRLSPTALKAVDLGEHVSESMKELVYELLLNKVKVEEIRPVLCTVVENMTNNKIADVPSNSWIRNFARITGLKVKPRNDVVL